MTFDELMKKPDKTETDQVLIQCVATISTHPGYTHMTPEEVFERQQEFAKSIQY